MDVDVEITVDDGAAAASRFTRKQIGALALPPTKGGVFTTAELKSMKSGDDEQSKEFRDKLHVHRTDDGWFEREENQL